MNATDWTLYLAGAALLAALALVLYGRREPGGPRRFLPAALRAAALALALLLVLDPFVPGIAAAGRGGAAVLLDDSWSMRLPADGGTRWDAAIAAVRSRGVDRVTLLSGSSMDVDDLDTLAPAAVESRVAPALRAAIESGAREIVLVTDGGLTDVDEGARILAGAGAALEVETVGGASEVANVAVAAVDATGAAAAGDTVGVRVDVAGLGMSDDSLRLVIEMGGEIAGEATLMAPADGRMATADVEIVLPDGSSDQRVALSARVVRMRTAADAADGRGGDAASDAFPEDDARPFFIDVQARPRGIVLLSLRPDWEPRFLLPVLQRSSGLPVRAYIRTPAGGYLTLGTGAGVARRVAEADVRADLERAAVAVLHGMGSTAPAWVGDRLSHPRLLLFPAADAATAALPEPLGRAAAGPLEEADWYVDEAAPASAVAAVLTELALAELPPLMALRGASAPQGTWAPLLARRDRRGTPRPVVVAGEAGNRRYVVATGHGYWRWALRGGDSRRAYGLFWSSMLGWLTEDLGAEGGDPIRPEPGVAERGAPLVWYVAGDADSLRVRLSRAAEPALDTVVPIDDDRLARTDPVDPGTLRWEATAGDVSATGELAVAAWSPEMVRSGRDLSSLSAQAAIVDASGGSRRRLHASAWPWLLLVGLLCGEWIARRRLGLR